MPDLSGIKRYNIRELEQLMVSWNEPAFRAAQLLQWVYGRGVQSYQDMTNLPNALRARLETEEPLAVPQILKKQVSADGTRKYLLRLADNAQVETVGIPDGSRLTTCFSTQAGCAMACTFCATGLNGLTRSLEPGEMVDQLAVVSQDFSLRVTNAVAMGEGEPFANYDATLAALRIMNSPNALGIGARHLTVSSCGLLRPLERFADEPEQFTLAISLHSAVQTTRNMLMPTLAGQPLKSLRAALRLYAEKTGRRPSLEFTLIAGVNDTTSEIDALVEFARDMLCHVNLIPLNGRVSGSRGNAGGSRGSTDDSRGNAPNNPAFVPSPPEHRAAIAARLQRAGIECTIRRSRGSDINGACGQLKGNGENGAT
ncbi:MAG: 23S rRNA (adenine(2503)-C(2))-methyltransferase RlmN [Coriobacteriales bacterium]|nr:23S rRNA (adenine(2503)-C(2))-methyltransferase RlmN [Coriobacteriales bacterium]